MTTLNIQQTIRMGQALGYVWGLEDAYSKAFGTSIRGTLPATEFAYWYADHDSTETGPLREAWARFNQERK